MNHNQAFTDFSITFKKMREKLIEWAFSKGGRLDTEGYMSGLQPNDNTHFDIRNQQLETIADYSTACETLIGEQQNEIERLKGRLRMAEMANREILKSDTDVLSQIDFLLAYEIKEDTTILDFESTLKDTLFYLELGLKRGIIEKTDTIAKKLHWSRIFLTDHQRLKIFYYHKKNSLHETHDSIKTLIAPASSD
jgi:hypothetical protein